MARTLYAFPGWLVDGTKATRVAALSALVLQAPLFLACGSSMAPSYCCGVYEVTLFCETPVARLFPQNAKVRALTPRPCTKVLRHQLTGG